MDAIILAAGDGLRMWPMTQVIPKCLLPVPGGKPCARNTAELLLKEKHKVSIVISPNHKEIYEHEFRDIDVKVIVSTSGGNVGSLLSAAKALRSLSSPFLLVYGDIYGFTEFKELTYSYSPLVTIAVSQSYHMPYGVAHIDKNKVFLFEEKPIMPDWWIGRGLSLWLGAAVMSSDILAYCYPGNDIAGNILTKLAKENKLNAYVSEIPCQDCGEWPNYKRLFESVK